MPVELSPMTEAPVGEATSASAQSSLGAYILPISLFSLADSLFGRNGYLNKWKKESPLLKEVKSQIAKDAPVPVIYGRKKVSGQIIFRENTPDSTFDMAVGLCEGEISDVTDIKINGRAISEVGDSDYDIYYGTSDQTADDRFIDGQISLPCEADAYIDETNKDANWNTDILLIAQGSWTVTTSSLTPGTRRAYIRFDLSKNIAGLQIIDARLRLQKSTIPGTKDRKIKCYGTTGDGAETWGENTITWNNAPTRGSQYTATTKVSQGGSFVDLSLNSTGLAALKAAYASGGKFSLEIAPDDDEILTFRSKDSEHVSPTLIITYINATANAFRNLAYLAMTVDNTSGLAGDNYPPVTAVIEGVKIRVWDGDSWTTEYNNNPAWVIYDILTHSRRGLGLSDSLFDADTFLAVADYCDELVECPDGTSQARYRCDVAFDTRGKIFEVIDIIKKAAGIFFYDVDGNTCLGIEKNEAVSHAFTMANIVKDSFGYSVLDRFDVPNILRVSYTEPAEDYKEVYVQADSEADRSDYGDKIQDLQLPTVNRKWEAVRRAHWLLWRGLLTEYMCKFRVSINNADVAQGDVCSITHDLPGWSAKKFRIIEVRANSADETELVCQQYIEKTAALETNLPNVAYIAPVGGESATGETVPDPPTWTLEPRRGGWLISVTGPVSGAVQYDIYRLNEDTQLYEALPEGMSLKDGRTDAAQEGTSLNRFISTLDPTGAKAYASFKLRTISKTRQSDLSDAQGAWSIPQIGAYETPQSPTLAGAESGYPVISKISKYNAFTFSIRNLIIAYAAEADFIIRYELQRRYRQGADPEPWSEWQSLPEKILLDPNTPNPRQIIYDNTDHLFIPGWYYQYRVRAIATNGRASEWSSAEAFELTDDTTAPDMPVFTATELPLMVRLDINAATQGGGECPDFAYWLIEKSDNSGSSWETLQAQWRDTCYKDVDLPATLETNRMYRITAYDYSGNASTTSTPTTNKKRKQISTTSLADGAITPDKANLSLHNWQLTTVWTASDYNTVAWGAGLLIDGTGTQYSIGVGNTGNMTAGYKHYVYFDIAVSTTAFQVTTTAANAVGEGKILVGACYPNSDTGKKAEFQMFGGAGYALRIITTDWLAADCITANEVLANTFTGAEFAATANITCGTGDNIIRLSGDDGTYRLWIGDAVAADAKFSVTKEGVMNCTGGKFYTASSGARLLIFPTSALGLWVSDGTNEVFRVYVGTDAPYAAGDIVIGNDAGQNIIWDASEGTFSINGQFASSGKLITGSGNERLEIGNIGGAEVLHLYSNNVLGVALQGFAGYGSIKSYTADHTGLVHIYGDHVSLGQNGSSDIFASAIILDNGGAASLPAINIYDGSGSSFGILKYNSLSLNLVQVLSTQQTGVSAMTNVSTPSNLNADTVTTAELADIVGNLINKLRTHGLVAN